MKETPTDSLSGIPKIVNYPDAIRELSDHESNMQALNNGITATEKGWLETAKALHSIKHNKTFLETEFLTFDEWIENDCAIARRTVYQLIKSYKTRIALQNSNVHDVHFLKIEAQFREIGKIKDVQEQVKVIESCVEKHGETPTGTQLADEIELYKEAHKKPSKAKSSIEDAEVVAPKPTEPSAKEKYHQLVDLLKWAQNNLAARGVNKGRLNMLKGAQGLIVKGATEVGQW